MSTFLPCPNCHKLLQAPGYGSLESKLQCPLCLFEIDTAELLGGLGQTWRVLEDPGGKDVFDVFHDRLIEPIGNEWDSEPPSMSATEEAHSQEAHGEMAGAESDAPKIQKVDWKQLQSSGPAGHRNRRTNKSPWSTIIQTILGGVAAVPIAMLLIWYALGKDPFELGPTVARFAPWIVPKDFRSQGADGHDQPLLRRPTRERSLAPLPNVAPELPNRLEDSSTVERKRSPAELHEGEFPVPRQESWNERLAAQTQQVERAEQEWLAIASSTVSNRPAVAQRCYQLWRDFVVAYARTLESVDMAQRAAWEQEVQRLATRIVKEPQLMDVARGGGTAFLRGPSEPGEGLLAQVMVAATRNPEKQGELVVKIGALEGGAQQWRWELDSRIEKSTVGNGRALAFAESVLAPDDGGPYWRVVHVEMIP
jgi:hypothetical protein